MYRCLVTLLLIMIVLFPLSGCWDKIEINELAIVSMVGVDYDPDTKLYTVYYQIVNPNSGASAHDSQGTQTPVYTYGISNHTFGEIRSAINRKMSRRLFVDHYEVLIVSEQVAKYDLRDVANFVEIQPHGRASTPMLVAKGSLSELMKQYALLEKLPADAIKSRLRFLAKESLFTGKKIEVRDLTEYMENERLIVLPVASMTSGQLSTYDERTAQIDATQANVVIGHIGAVIQDYRLVGEINQDELVLYNILNGETGFQARSVELEGKQLTCLIKPVNLQKRAHLRQGRPVVSFQIDMELSSSLTVKYLPGTWQEAKSLQEEMERIKRVKFYAFYQKMKERNWDLFGIKDIVKRQLPDYEVGDDLLDEAEVEFNVNVKYVWPGHITEPY